MGCYDVYCLLCGNPCHSIIYNDDNFLNLNEKEFGVFKKITDWLYRCTILTVNNEIIHNCREVSCNVEFIAPNKNQYIASLDYSQSTKNKGLFIHDDCWIYIKNKHGIELKFGDLANTKKLLYNPLSYIKYGEIENYWGQDFNYPSIIKDKNLWFSTSPLISERNAKRINHVIKQMKIKKGRKGPTLSASFYKSGIIKFGNNNKFWIVNQGKWVEMKGEIKINKVELEDKHYKIPQLGETNTKPIFIKEFLTEKKQHYVMIISLES